jgi:hypothetical protein
MSAYSGNSYKGWEMHTSSSGKAFTDNRKTLSTLSSPSSSVKESNSKKHYSCCFLLYFPGCPEQQPIGNGKPTPCITRYDSTMMINVQENFDKRDKKEQINFPLRHNFPLKVVK